MDLSSGRLFWPSTCKPPRVASPLSKDVSCEALVVGSGITGAMVTWHLAGRGVDVVMIDRRTLAAGSTPASTALLQYEIDTTLRELAEQVGSDHAARAYLASRRALDDMIGLVGQLDDACELRTRHSLFLASSAEQHEELRNELNARRKIGLAVEFLDREALRARFGIDRPAALMCDLALEINPLKLTYALHRAGAAMGARMFTGVELVLPEAARLDGPLPTRAGPTIRCKHLIIATGYETPEQFGPVCRLTSLKSTYAMVTEPLPESPWPEEPLVWELADPYSYARTTPDRRIILGGEDEDFSDAAARDQLLPKKVESLKQKLSELFPRWAGHPVSHAWAGTFAETSDGLPYIGMHPRYPDTHFCLGYGGNGITFSLLAAQITTGAVVGEPRLEAELFRFDRYSTHVEEP